MFLSSLYLQNVYFLFIVDMSTVAARVLELPLQLLKGAGQPNFKSDELQLLFKKKMSFMHCYNNFKDMFDKIR